MRCDGGFILELRTPLSLIVGHAGVIQKELLGDVTEGQRTSIDFIDNAIEFTYQDHAMISARLLAEAGRVEFKVADTRLGIRKENLPAIFKKVRQPDSSAALSYDGVGLGLFIVKRFAGILGGKRRVSSKFGKGSTFTLTPPVSALSKVLDGLDGSTRGFHV